MQHENKNWQGLAPIKCIISGQLSILRPEVLYVKKNIFSDNKKSSKGFYAALGISAVMIGSACYFAYDQGEKMTREITAKNTDTQPTFPVDGIVTNIPKQTTSPAYRETVPVYTTSPVLTAGTANIPAAATATETVVEAAAVGGEEAVSAASVKLENVKSPLAEMGDIQAIFSGKELVKSPTTGSWQTHNGTDISAEVGSEVYAVSNGVVSAVTSDPVWGVTVELDHYNGYITRYCSLSEDLSVQEGDTVLSGDLLGLVGETADIESAQEPHLHIEVLLNGSYIDPLSIIK